MKRALFLLLPLLPTRTAIADFATPFTAPPYTLGASVLGMEGWASRLKDYAGDGASSRLVAVRWDNFQPALLLDGASIKNDFPATTGARVRVTLRIAFTFPMIELPLAQTRILIQNAPFGEIIFKCHPQAGLGLAMNPKEPIKVLVPFDQMRLNSYYTVTILVDYEQSSYDVTATGLKHDGSPLLFEEKGIHFESNAKFLKNLALITSQTARTYIQQLLIESL